MNLKISPAKQRTFCAGTNVLIEFTETNYMTQLNPDDTSKILAPHIWTPHNINQDYCGLEVCKFQQYDYCLILTNDNH